MNKKKMQFSPAKIRDLGAVSIEKSNRKNKKWVVELKSGEKVHFGDSRYQDFTQHRDNKRRLNYLARATKIKDSKGNLTKNDPTSPNYWSVRLLWDG